MSKAALTLEAVKEQFCTADKREALKQMADQLESVWDTDKAAELTVKIGEKTEKETAAAGVTWTPGERLLWFVKEAFILGSLDMAVKMMLVNDVGYEALAGEGADE